MNPVTRELPAGRQGHTVDGSPYTPHHYLRPSPRTRLVPDRRTIIEALGGNLDLPGGQIPVEFTWSIFKRPFRGERDFKISTMV